MPILSKLNTASGFEKLAITPELEQKVLFSLLEDMSGEKEKLAEQAKVNVSILEDINNAQEELKKRYAELDTLKDLIKELGSSLKTAIVLQTLLKALKKILPESVNFAYAIPSPDPGAPSNLIYVHSSAAIGQEYLNCVKKNIELSFDVLPAAVKRKEELVEWIHGKFIFEFVKGTRDNKNIKQPLSSFNAPFVVRDEVLGVINISSFESDLFAEKDINLVHTMVGATASTISRLRQLLQSEQSRIASLVESLSNGVIMFDLDQRVTMSNPMAQKMTGLPREGFYLSEFTKLFEEAVLDEKISQVLQKGQDSQIAGAILSRFTYELFITPVLDHEKKVIGGAIILHDITHLKEIDKMKTEFVSVASHQLRTPLTAIKLFIEMLSDEDAGKLNAKQKEYMSDVRKSTERMITLVNDLLNVSRLETGRLKIEPQPTQLEDFIQSVIDEGKYLAKEIKCQIVFKKPAAKLPKIPVDQTLMTQVIRNLIANAARYSPDSRCKIVIELKHKQSEILISVKDNGIGIPKDKQSRIFEKFFRADNAQKTVADGSGLGLYVAKMIVEESGGKIWFESPGVGKGATFYVSLPIKGMSKKEGERGLAA